MTQPWLRQPNCPERLRLAVALAQIERAADRYSAVGRTDTAGRLRGLGRQGRFMSVHRLTERYQQIIGQPVVMSDRVTAPISEPRGYSGHHEALRFSLTPDRIRIDGGAGWRNRNPGYLPYNGESRDLGAIGSTDGLAIFPADQVGRAAFETYLRSAEGKSLALQDIYRRIGDYESGLDALAVKEAIQAAAGGSDIQLAELEDEALSGLAGIVSDEVLGWRGHEYSRRDRNMPAWVRAKFAAVASQTAQHMPDASENVPAFFDARRPADVYVRAADLCVITAFFNPCMSHTRTRNFTAFLRSLSESNVHWRCIECAFGDREFELPPDPRIIQIRSRSILWQKERLLNVLIAQLPDQFSKVAWIDADVLFSNPYWLPEASDALADYAVIQPFEESVRLPEQGFTQTSDAQEAAVSFAALFRKQPESVAGNDFWAHGHTGFAWAGRRDWLQSCGLYEAALSGTADHLMAHAFVGTWECPCVFERMEPGPRWNHFDDWCANAYDAVRSLVSSIPGTVYSFWHGSVAARNDGYYRADHRLDALGFDPYDDVGADASGTLEWTSAKPALHQWAIDYFRSRDEGPQADG